MGPSRGLFPLVGDYIKILANYSVRTYDLTNAYNPMQRDTECKTWCHPLKVSFTEPGKKIQTWTKGIRHEWGLMWYQAGTDPGLIYVKLSIETPYIPVGPDQVLAPLGPKLKPSAPSAIPAKSAKITSTPSPHVPLPAVSSTFYLTSLVQGAFKVLNATNPEATQAC